MRPVIDFLNRLDAEKGRDEDKATPLTNAVDDADLRRLSKFKKRDAFLAPKTPPERSGPPAGRIQYSKPLGEIEIAKKLLRVSTLKEVGEKTFDYFLKHENG